MKLTHRVSPTSVSERMASENSAILMGDRVTTGPIGGAFTRNPPAPTIESRSKRSPMRGFFHGSDRARVAKRGVESEDGSAASSTTWRCAVHATKRDEYVCKPAASLSRTSLEEMRELTLMTVLPEVHSTSTRARYRCITGRRQANRVLQIDSACVRPGCSFTQCGI